MPDDGSGKWYAPARKEKTCEEVGDDDAAIIAGFNPRKRPPYHEVLEDNRLLRVALRDISDGTEEPWTQTIADNALLDSIPDTYR